MLRAFREYETRRVVAVLLFAPLLAYSFFSAHTMPRFTDQGFEIVICSGDGTDTLLQVDGSDRNDSLPKTPCDWSIQIHVAALADAPPTLTPVRLAWAETDDADTTVLRSGRIASGRNARAPPILL
jgi:hypothetical protein